MNSNKTLTILLLSISFITTAQINLKSSPELDSLDGLKLFGEVVTTPKKLINDAQDHAGIIYDTTFDNADKAGTTMDPGISGTWWNSSQSGHGYMIEVMTGGSLLMSWYVYDSFGDPIYLTGIGNLINESTVRFEMLYVSGMIWGIFDPTNVVRENWGIIDITFNSCDSAFLSYNSSYVDQYGTSYGSGSLPITRITSIESLPCNYSTNSTTLTMTNQLLNDIEIYVNGNFEGTILAEQTQSSYVEYSGDLIITWEIIRTQTGSGTPIGDVISGSYNNLNTSLSNHSLTVDNVFSNGNGFFVPFVENKTGASILIGVNMGLESENRCNCTVPANSGGYAKIGYYHWFSNSNVRSYASGSNYTGSYSTWNNFDEFVQENTGRLNLVLN